MFTQKFTKNVCYENPLRQILPISIRKDLTFEINLISSKNQKLLPTLQ